MLQLIPQTNFAFRVAWSKAALFLLVALFGSALPAKSQVLLEENFTFTGALTANGWTAVSGTNSNAITAAAPGLSYPNLPSSGVGNAASLTTSGEDDRKTFAVNSNSIYSSCLINLSAARTGDYFYALSSGSTGFFGRMFARTNTTGGFQLGVQKTSTGTPTYATTNLSFGTTYFAVIKITKNGSTNDDVAGLWINPVLGGAETAPDAASTNGTDQNSLDSLILRQGSATAAPTVRVGNILVGTTWASVTPTSAAGGPSITTFTPTSGPAGTVVTITGTNFTGATAVTFNGLAATIFTVDSPTQITATVPVGATTGPIAVATPAGFNSSADSFTVPSSTVTLPAQILEGATGTGTVTLTSAPASDVVVSLVSSSPADLVVPASVTVAAGFTTADFEIQAPLDGTVDSDVVVTVTPTATGFVGVPANITVKNIDLSTVALTSGGYTQSFAGFTSAATLPLGWSLTGSVQTYSEWETSTVAGAKYTSATVQVFGYQHTGSTRAVQQVLTMRNETGAEINSLTISYKGRIALPANGRSPSYTVTVDGQTVEALAYSTADGDNVARSASLSGLTIAPNQVFQLIWASDGDAAPGSGTRRQIGISDVSVSPTAAILSPSVSGLTVPTAQISQTSASGVSANVTSDGGSAITARGFVYAPTSVNPDPTIGGTGVVNLADPLAEVGQMVATLTPLTPSTGYSVKAYAINAQGTTYTSVQTFATLAPPASFTGNYEYPFDNFTGVSGLPGEWTAISSTGAQNYVGLWNSGSSTGGFYGGVSAPGVLGYTHTSSTGTLTVTLRLINNTGSTLTQLNVGYLGRVERVAETRTPEWTVTVAGVAAPDLTYSTSAGVDETKVATVTGLNVAPGDGFTIVWSCDRGTGTGSSRRIGLANVVVSTSAITVPNIVTSTNSLTDLKAVPSQPGTPQNFSVSGSNLNGDITITAPAGFELARLPGSTYQDSLSLPPDAGTVSSTEIAVRLKAQAAGSPSGTILLDSQGATKRNISVSGTVSDPNAPNLFVDPASLSSFATTSGAASDPKTFTVTGTNLQADAIVTSPTGYQVSLDGNSWSSTVTLSRVYSAFDDFYVNVPATGGEGSYTRTTWIANAGTVPFDTGLTNPNTWGYAGGNFNGVGAPSSVGTYVSGGNFYPLTSGGIYAGPGASYALPNTNFWIGYNDQYGTVGQPNAQTQIGKYTREWFSGSPNWLSNSNGTNNKFLWLQGTGLQSSTDGLGAILTWTAPNAGTFTFNGSYVNGNYGPSTSFAIVDSLNNTNLARQTLAPSSSTNSFSFTRTYSAGDVVQFQVGTPAASQGSPLGLSVEVTPAVSLSRIVYVRIAPTAPVGPLSGNVVVSSTGAGPRSVAVSGTVLQPATVITVSTNVISGLSTTRGSNSAPTNFTVSAMGLGSSNLTVSVAPTNDYVISTNSAGVYSTNLVLTNVSGAVPSTELFVRISSTAPTSDNLTGTIDVRGAGAAKSIALTNGVVNPAPGDPVLTLSTNSIGFGNFIFDQAPAPQSFQVSGTDLVAPIGASASGNYQIATNSGGPWSTTLAGLGSPTTVFVRVQALGSKPSAASTNLTGAVTLSSLPAGDKVVQLSSAATWPAATITRNPASLTLNRVEGEPPPVTNFVVSASNVVGSLTVDPPTGYEWTVDTNNPASWRDGPDGIPASVEGTLTNASVYVRMTNSAPGSYSGTLALRAPSASGVNSVVANVGLSGSVVPKPVVTVNPSALDSFVTVQSKASTNQTFKVSATNLLGDVTLSVTNLTTADNTIYEISTNGIDYSGSITLPAVDAPVAASRRAAAATPTVIASDNAANYGTPASNTWGDGANLGTGFLPWVFRIVNNSSGTPPPPFYAGAFLGDPNSAGITGMGTNAFGLYANPQNTPAAVSVTRGFAAPLKVGDSFSTQWAVNWDPGDGFKGFNLYAGGTNGTEVANINQGNYPGTITVNGQEAINGQTGYGNGPMTWTFKRTTSSNLLITSTSRNGTTNVVFTTNISAASPIDTVQFYVTAMTAGDQRQPYFNNLEITSSGGGSAGKIVPETTIYARIAANALTNSPASTVTAVGGVGVSSPSAENKEVRLEGVINPRPQPSVNVTGTNFNFFAAVAGGTATQVMQVGGSNLWTAITVNSQSPFVVSTNRAGAFSSQAVLTPDANEVVASTNVFVQFAPAAGAAAGVVTNSISVSSAPASPQAFDLVGRVYPANVTGPQGAIDFIAAPLAWFTTTTNTPSAPQAFYVSAVGLTQNLLVTAPDGFEVSNFSNGPYNKNVDFILVPGASTVSGQLYVRMAQSSTPGTVLGDLVLSSGGATLAAADLQGTVFGKTSGAEAVVTPSALTGFSAAVGNSSASQAFTLAARGLTAPTLTLAASAGYEISIDGGTSYATTASLTAIADGGTWILPPADIMARLSATASPGLVVAGTVTVTNGTPPTALATVTLGGSVAGAPSLQATANFVSFLGIKSAAEFPVQTFTVSGSWLTQSLSVTAPANFQVSLNGTNWSSSVSIAPTSSGNTGGVVPLTTVSVRIAPSAPNGAVAGNLTAASSGQQQTLPVEGKVYATPPPATISVAPAQLNGFATTAGTPSAAQTFLVDGINLDGPITIKAPPGFRVDPSTITPVAQVVEDAVVSVWVGADAPAGLLKGEVVLESNGAEAVKVTVSATVLGNPGAPAQSFNTGTGVSGAPAGTKPTVMGIARVPSPSDPSGLFYIAGDFTTYNGVKAPGIARLRADGSVDTTFDPGTGPNAPIRTIAVQSTREGNSVLVGGDFTTFNGQPANRLVRLLPSGKIDPTFNAGTGAGGTVRALSVQWDGKVLVGGDFEHFSTQPVNFLVRLQPGGEIDTAFRTGGDFGPNAPVHALSLDSANRVYIGGWFGGVDGLPSNRIARLLPDGKFDPTFNVRGGVGNNIQAANQDPYRTGTITSGLVNAIVVTQSGRVIVGGDFNTAAGRPGLAYRLAAFNPNGTPVLDFNNRARTDGEVTSLALLPDGRIAVGGTFTFLDFKWNPGLAIINELGVPDPNFFAPANAGQTLGLQALAVLPDGNLLFGGDFSKVNGATQSGVGMMYTTDGLLPLISSGTELTGVLGKGFLYFTTTTAINPDGVSYSWKAAPDSSLPPGLQLGFPGAGVIGGTPTKAGIYRFTLTATNTAGSDSANITLTVVDAAPASTTTKVDAPPTSPQTAALQLRAGRYVGLLAQSALNRQMGGLVDLTLQSNRAVLGTAVINGHKRTFSGKLDNAGRLKAKTRTLKGQPVYDIDLGYVATPKSAPRVTGTVGRGAQRAPFSASYSPWSAAQPATKLAGRYNAALRVESVPARSAAAGGGVVTLTAQASGAVQLQGRLSDGKAFTWAGRLGADGVVPVHIALTASEVLHGSLRLANAAAQGSLLWVSVGPPAKASIPLRVEGGLYGPQTEARRALGPAAADGRLAMTIAGGGVLAGKMSAAVTVAKDGSLVGASTAALTGGRFDPRTGTFTARMAADGSRKAGKLHAVWIPRLKAAYGWVSWPNGSAPLTLRPPAK